MLHFVFGPRTSGAVFTCTLLQIKGGLLPSRRLEGRKPDEIDLAPNSSFFSIDCGERLPCGAAGQRGTAPLTERKTGIVTLGL